MDTLKLFWGKTVLNKYFWIYTTLALVASTGMTILGYPIYTWQWWVALGCVIGAFLCGRYDERNG